MYAPTSCSLPFGHKQEVKLYLEKSGFDSFQPQAVLFDMDGVLYDSMPNHARCWQEAMAKFGLKMTAADVYATEGMRGVETIRLMVKAQQGRDISEDEAQMMYDEKARLFGLLPKAPIMEGVLELMEKIKLAGMQIVVVTGSGQRPLIERLQHDFKDFVTADKIVSAYDVTRGKPAPDPYLMGLQKAGNLQPWQGVVVENAPMGVRAGVAARIFTIAVNSGPLPNATLAGEGANIVFDRMTQLCDVWVRNTPDFSFISHTVGKAMVAEIAANDMLLAFPEDANDLLGNAYYQGFEGMIISTDKISPRFFDLKTKLAGEVLQKFSAFRMRLAIVGDFSAFPSESLQSFICESNRGRLIHFSPTTADALAWFEA